MADDAEPKRPRRPFHRARVTLTMKAEPLRLPSNEPPAPEPETSPPPAEPEVEDGWGRLRPAKTTPPPAPAVAEVAAEPPAGRQGDALDLVTRRSRRRSSGSIDHATEMADRFALGDYTEALSIAELILGRAPDHEAARRIAKSSRERLEQLYTSRLGSLARVPVPALDASQVRWLGLDHRAAFLLSRADGTASIDDLVEISGMPRLEALKTLVELLELGAIRFS